MSACSSATRALTGSPDLTTIGLAMGGNARTGMEDTLMVEPGKPAISNAQLVERLVGVARSLNREPAAVAEVVERLKLSPELVGQH